MSAALRMPSGVYEFPRPSTPEEAPRQSPKSPPKRSRKPDGYTLAHAGRQVRIGPVAFWIVVGTLVVMAVWSVGTGTYFAFKDDLLKRLIARQAQMQYAYEDRIADLRMQVDRLTSRQLLDQETVEQKLEQLLRKQAVLEQRSATLSNLPDQLTTGSIKRGSREDSKSDAGQKPTPLDGQRGRDRGAALGGGAVHASAWSLQGGTRSARGAANVEGTIAELQVSFDRVAQHQANLMKSLEERYDAKAKRLRTALNSIGADLGKEPASPRSGGVGGPFIPANLRNDGSFEAQLQRISLAKAQTERLTRALSTVPIRMPIKGEVETTSGFGVRVDPFLRSPAMHSGLDFRGTTGDPVYVTAAGKVSNAGWQGGYGRMVEVDHGNGYSTRYGHLSSIDVKEGQVVRAGQLIGRVGSTGRSTGPHLHYETRVDGDAIDPQKFLRAGASLGGLLELN